MAEGDHVVAVRHMLSERRNLGVVGVSNGHWGYHEAILRDLPSDTTLSR
jgi:hypothetical protein